MRRAAPTVAIDTKFAGLRGLFSGEGLFWLRAREAPSDAAGAADAAGEVPYLQRNATDDDDRQQGNIHRRNTRNRRQVSRAQCKMQRDGNETGSQQANMPARSQWERCACFC
jgi:hypothetical protein